jgi:hypothetical protein
MSHKKQGDVLLLLEEGWQVVGGAHLQHQQLQQR